MMIRIGLTFDLFDVHFLFLLALSFFDTNLLAFGEFKIKISNGYFHLLSFLIELLCQVQPFCASHFQTFENLKQDEATRSFSPEFSVKAPSLLSQFFNQSRSFLFKKRHEALVFDSSTADMKVRVQLDLEATVQCPVTSHFLN
jgi:hypothetical protein